MKEGKTYDDIVKLLRRRYRKRPEQVWQELAAIKWHSYDEVEHYIMAIEKK